MRKEEVFVVWFCEVSDGLMGETALAVRRKAVMGSWKSCRRGFR